MLNCWSTGPTDPILSKNKKIILQDFDQLASFLIYYFLLLEKNKKQNTKNLYNNQNQEAFIVIIVN